MGPDEQDPDEVQVRVSDRTLSELDDELDREELRNRYYGLLQELRVILPGVQVLLAFLLTAPFADRFPELDDPERATYGIALVASFLSVICLLTPAVFHRVGERTARSARLRWGIRMTVAGLALVAVALASALWSVSRFVFSNAVARGVLATAIVAILGLWVALPIAVSRMPPNVRPGGATDES